MHNEFPYKKFVKVNARNITWQYTYYDLNLPKDVMEFEVAVDEDVDPSEKWCTVGLSGFEILCEALYDQLSKEYNFEVICIDDVEVIE
jgi:hypothetical protein